MDQSSEQLLINALEVSRLTFCDSLLVAIPQAQLKKVQRVWNMAVKIAIRAGKYDHVTPILERLGWASM